MMKFDCLLAGVGGQGTVLASKIIAQTAIDKGYFVRTCETIGMAQRGGCVVSHVRIGSENSSPLIPKQEADLIIGFEPSEAVRSIGFLKKEGSLLVNTQPIIPVTASLGGSEYKAEDMMNYLKSVRENVIFADGQKLCEKVESAKVLNVIMIGVAVKKGLLPFSKEDVILTIQGNLPQKFIALNTRAIETGYEFEQYL